eukprot:4989310-Alexandrium_andersonii.AAC.1
MASAAVRGASEGLLARSSPSWLIELTALPPHASEGLPALSAPSSLSECVAVRSCASEGMQAR